MYHVKEEKIPEGVIVRGEPGTLAITATSIIVVIDLDNEKINMSLQSSDLGVKTYLDARFGMFIHWGLYSIVGKDAWWMHEERISVAEYEKLAEQFNPLRFNADEWVSLAADAGQKYIVITSRHHDGFSMFDTALSDYKITHTPFHRDPLAELANACARRGDIRMGFYSSLLDWHHPAYRFRDTTGLVWEDYVGFLHGQVRELCTNFGPLACLWFDGEWPRDPCDPSRDYFKAGGPFQYDRLYDMIHTLQPDAVVINNRHDRPLPGEDVQNFEQDLPGENINPVVSNFAKISSLPLEVCMTINDSWGIRFEDHNHKSASRLIHLLCRSSAAGANYLLNIGPTADGEVLPVQATRLRQMGAWLQKHGEAIYATHAGKIQAEGCVSTSGQKGWYVIALEHPGDGIRLRNVPASADQAALLDGTSLPAKKSGDQWLVEIPPEARDPIATVIKIHRSMDTN